MRPPTCGSTHVFTGTFHDRRGWISFPYHSSLNTATMLRSISRMLFLLAIMTSYASPWWLLSETDPERIASYPSACSVVPGLSEGQRNLCSRHPDTMKYLIDGLRMAISECQHAFRNQVWNCTLTTPGVEATPLKIASKESAYVYAIASAGVSHSLAKACAKGLIEDCGCGPTPSTVSNTFVWAGCSDNVRYGNSFGRKFIDVNDKAQGDARALMNLHNNRVGRRLLATRMGKECKCHGVSGSCVTKTCWKVVPKFDDFAQLLKYKYEMAQQVTVAPHGTALMIREPISDSKRSGRYLKDKSDKHKAAKGDLVYLDASPDYCSVNTRGRDCGNNCDEICCGRGWHTVREIVDEPCHCRFIWCCDVQCKTCKKIVDRNFCR
ncbi:unnamed protein product [Cylicocyclus nassatus]|uniref:Protein Wnt n=1 Tax=Cylicocyclus nassatus TaxID=53992 RepID=A0AA36M8E0_CYLNA|nr:unnamed protein product [Cylicocyclus nassatus]